MAHEITYGPLTYEATLLQYKEFVEDDARAHFGIDYLNLQRFEQQRNGYLMSEHKYSRSAIRYYASGLVDAWARDAQIADDFHMKAFVLETMYPEHIAVLQERQYAAN